MKRIMAALVAALMITTVSYAGVSISAGPEMVVPVGDFGDGAGVGFGGTLRAGYDITPNIYAGVNTGYLQFGEENNLTASAVPIEAELRYAFTDFVPGLRVGALIGTYAWMYDLGVAGADDPDTEWEFAIAPTIGYTYMLNDQLGIDAEGRFQYAGESGGEDAMFFGFRLGLAYSLK